MKKLLIVVALMLFVVGCTSVMEKEGTEERLSRMPTENYLDFDFAGLEAEGDNESGLGGSF